ncbi:MAG: McrC family protein [Gemmatimonas sp.]
MRNITVREYARLTTDAVQSPGLDEQQISESAFNWLCAESARLQSTGARLVQVGNTRWLRLDNYVGVIETPCGTRIEILPKSTDGSESASASRRLLRKMLAQCLDLSDRTLSKAAIAAFDAPLDEWVMAEFLQALQVLVKRGVRFDYHNVQEEQRFLRGRLEVSRQLRQPPSRQHVFQVEHDVFDADRPENRLLRSALDRVCKAAREPSNWRLSHELSSLLSNVPRSLDIANDLRRWRNDRLLAHYKPIRPWTALILGEQTPLTTLGEWHGASLLFPMERVFERYVEACLRRELPSDVVMRRQVRQHHLAQHRGESWFTLMPDFHFSRGDQVWVLDTKWKRLSEAKYSAGEKYDLNQSDFYQLFAYAQKYQDGVGDVFLVYPKTADFSACLEGFEFSDRSTLWVVPFDLEAGRPDKRLW